MLDDITKINEIRRLKESHFSPSVKSDGAYVAQNVIHDLILEYPNRVAQFMSCALNKLCVLVIPIDIVP